MTWHRIDSAGALNLILHVQPGAKTTEISGLHGEALKVRLAAPPVDGKANAVLIAFVSETLNVPKGNVEIAAGATSRRKVLRIVGVPDSSMGILRALGEGS